MPQIRSEARKEKAKTLIFTEGSTLDISNDMKTYVKLFGPGADTLFGMIWNPLKNKEDILARQDVITKLIGQDPILKKALKDLQNKAHGWRATMDWLLDSEREYRGGGH